MVARAPSPRLALGRSLVLASIAGCATTGCPSPAAPHEGWESTNGVNALRRLGIQLSAEVRRWSEVEGGGLKWVTPRHQSNRQLCPRVAVGPQSTPPSRVSGPVGSARRETHVQLDLASVCRLASAAAAVPWGEHAPMQSIALLLQGITPPLSARSCSHLSRVQPEEQQPKCGSQQLADELRRFSRSLTRAQM